MTIETTFCTRTSYNEIYSKYTVFESHQGDKMKPLIICYTDQHKNVFGTSLQRYVERNLGAELSIINSWPDLVIELTRNPVAVVLNISLIDPAVGCKPLVEKIKRLCIRTPQKINFGVYIDSENSQDVINILQIEDIVGIVPNPEHFGIGSTVEALRGIMHGKSHWPNDVIACLPQQAKTKQIKNISTVSDPNESDGKTTYNVKHIDQHTVVDHGKKSEITTIEKFPNVVYFRFDHGNSPKCTTELSKKVNSTWTMPNTWQDLTREIESGERIVATHVDMIEQSGTTIAEFVDIIQTMVKYMPTGDKLRLGVVITKQTNIKVVHELQQTSITGLLLDINEFAFNDVSNALSALIAGKHYWPDHIINALPGGKPAVTKNDGITLTERQAQIANLICKRGLSNKKVANMLSITESTVKAHVSAILKAYGVRNRTQLVLSAHK